MKDVKTSLLERRSVRRYEREPVSQEALDLIYEAIRNTPTSYNGQQFSVIDVTDQAVKEEIYGLTGQKQIKTCSHFMLFCADYYKIGLIAREKGIDMPDFAKTADGVIVGVVDATLAMMSAIVAAESMELGVCPIGYARTAAPEQLAALLKLPKGVFVVCGLAIGVPREMPDLKPKQPLGLTVFPDVYRQDADGMLSDLVAYDKEVKEYNAHRSGTKSDNDWASHIVGYYDEACGFRMLEALQSRGFDVRH